LTAKDAAASSGKGRRVARLATIVPATAAVVPRVFETGPSETPSEIDPFEIDPEMGLAIVATGTGNMVGDKGGVLRATVSLSTEGATEGAAVTGLGSGSGRLVAIAVDAATFDSGGGGVKARATICVSTTGAAVTAGFGWGRCPEEAVFAAIAGIGTRTLTLAGGATESRSMVCVFADGPAAGALDNEGAE
jgi:hypothetical protein